MDPNIDFSHLYFPEKIKKNRKIICSCECQGNNLEMAVLHHVKNT